MVLQQASDKSIRHLYELYLQHPAISTDTRKIAPGSLFFALKGENFDANTFAVKAIEAGAAYAIIDNPGYKVNDRYILVADALTTLQELARHHRQQLTIPVIGLTGTNGKTTTKELINAVLAQRFKTQFTQGNLNNHIGVPLTILTINSSHQMAVIEMGANHQKEIGFLCSITQPTHGLITNVGKAHLEGFGGVEGVKKGKGEMYDYLRNLEITHKDSAAFINKDNPILQEMQKARGLENVTWYGTTEKGGALVTGELIENSPYLTVRWKNHRDTLEHVVKTQLTGAYNLDNILAAICIGVYFGLNDAEINLGIEYYQPQNNRSQIKQTITNTLICDYYNANPSSMAVAIENIAKLNAAHKVLILGDMFELGEEAPAEHEAIIRKALDSKADELIFVGKEFANAANSAEIKSENKPLFYPTAAEAIAALTANPVKNSTVLIKGSRGMALERLVDLL
jgi:UDP-N-acetylmuramoyl-tripeptide--D-alanyl-D-alanine ligase